MTRLPTPKPIRRLAPCSICGYPWGDHPTGKTAEECIDLMASGRLATGQPDDRELLRSLILAEAKINRRNRRADQGTRPGGKL